MNKMLHSFCWGAVLIAVAIASRYGTMDRGSAITLSIVLPLVAWMSLTGRASCSLRRRA